ncbi:MAG: sulfatase-like hydrolase/transferase [Muribaculaceae bacterium]|nr:sulfatase-like hydrolase/transferase [Muribaculaceae bacterium]
MKLWLLSASCLLGAIGQFSYFRSSWGWRNDIRERSFREALQEHYTGEFSEYRRLYSYSGPVWYGVRYLTDIYQVLFSRISLSDAEKDEIRSLLSDYERSGGASEVADSLNVVYIIVESLNSDMVEKEIEGRKVMPALDSLSRLDGTVWVSNVESQIRASSSSDGHLLLLTGLLPPDKISYSIAFGSSNRFPSLADRFPRHEKRLLLADDGVCWNEGNTLRNFGLGEPVTTLDRDENEIEMYGRDGAMFRQAAGMVRTLKQPFFMTLMTISMHIPFREKGWDVPDWIENAGDLSRMEKDYANTCSHTDMYLAEFLRALPDNTMVFIASDHHQTIASGPGRTPAAMMMAIHTPLTQRVSRRVGQANLFPAALDLLGINEGYAGVAPSAFSADATADDDSLARARRISDLIIRGDYFQATRR